MRFLSLFSGMGAPEIAWQSLGWECAAQSEIEPAACALLAHRFPGVPNLGDVSKITEDQIAALGRIDLIVGGFPCQDVSIAGKRKGLTDESGERTRSGLFFEAMRLVRIARRRCGLRWVVIENVPGLFSNREGQDFREVVGEIVGARFDVPRGGWESAGAACGPDGLVEWDCLDAQFFALAQRRERVFFVADFGAWADRSPVLLERESMRGNPAPRREAGAGVARTLSASTGGASAKEQQYTFVSGDGEPLNALDADSAYIPEIVPQAMSAKWSKGTSGPAGDEVANLVAFRAAGQDGFAPSDLAPPLAASDGGGAGIPTIAFTGKDYGQDAHEDYSPTLRAMNELGGHANAGGQVAVAFKPSHFTRGKDGAPSDVCPPLSADADKGDQDPLIFQGQFVVRRLTPRECERLQGFPDDWTLVPYRGRMMADGPRYKMLGNSMARPVLEWIGRQIERAHKS